MCYSRPCFLYGIFNGDLHKHFDSHLETQKCGAFKLESLAAASQSHTITFCISYL